MAATADWFASWFDSPHYHRLYAHRDDTEAARFLDALIARLGPGPEARALDLGCGAGRHAKYLASRGLYVTGLDLAAGSIRAAKLSERPGLRFRRQDMRAPFGRSRFDYVFNFFTSFGYFDDTDDNLTVVGNIARSLCDSGRLVLDYLNAAYAAARLVPHETNTVDSTNYLITRWMDRRHFFKRIRVERASGQRLEYVERVARFSLGDFARMFAAEGLTIESVYGDYALREYDRETSPRMILIARKRERMTDADYARDRFRRTRLSVSGVTPRYDASMNCGTR